MKHAELLLKTNMPFVEDLLVQYGEFFPVASAIKVTGEIVQVGTYGGSDCPLSSALIEDLKTALKAKQADYLTVAVFYDVHVTNPNTNIKTDAIAVFIETLAEENAHTIFYPYTLTDQQLAFENTWKEFARKEVFETRHL